jgi:hypothetical protein
MMATCDAQNLALLSSGRICPLKAVGLLIRDCEAGPANTLLSACMIRGGIATVRRMGSSISMQVPADCVEVLP